MGQFFKQTFASLIGSLAGLILFFTLGISGLIFLLAWAASRDQGPTVEDKSVLVFDLSVQISDTKSLPSLGEALSGQDTKVFTLRQVLDSLEKAAKDERIVAILLDGRRAGSSSGYATLTEVRAALERCRDAGKKIIAYDVNWSEKEYYLGSVADTVVLNPIGAIEINGLSSQQLFLTGALQKYGVGVQVIRVGNYKAAVEPFTRQDLSPESRQQTEELLAGLWGNFSRAVGKSRKLTPEKLQAIADSKGILLAKEARTSGLVDKVAYFDRVVAEFKELTGNSEEDRSFRQIPLKTYADVPLNNAQDRNSENQIALVYAEGTIVDGKGTIEQIGGDRLAQELGKLRQDQKVKAVVVRVNSPGGSATASDVILREMQLTRQQKPVIVSMGNFAASGGYWIATGADRIFAQVNTITGSIGVFGLFPNIEEISNNNGITWDVVKTGRFADMGTIARPKTEQELAIYQKYVNQIYEMFLDRVAESRKLPRDKVAEIAQGRVWSGEDAHKIGLIDQIGGLEAAIEYAAEKAELGRDWEIEEYPKKRSFEAEILKRLLGAEAVQPSHSLDPLTAEFLKFKDDLTIFQSLNDPRGIYARLPFNLRIE